MFYGGEGEKKKETKGIKESGKFHEILGSTFPLLSNNISMQSNLASGLNSLRTIMLWTLAFLLLDGVFN